MNDTPSQEKLLIASIFSDETETFRTPSEPERGDMVEIRLRLMKDIYVQVTLLVGYPTEIVPMKKCGSDDSFDWYSAWIECQESAIFYSFLIELNGSFIHYWKTGYTLTDSVPFPDPAHAFRIQPGFHVPEWAKGAVQYQIFVDRFCNGCKENDVVDREYYYINGYANHASSWDALPKPGDFRTFYGGDLQGVMEKLDYLQKLGVEVLYLNPIFVSPSSHKYDSQDYHHVDPHFSQLALDKDAPLRKGDHDNAHAAQYILRTTDENNLRESDAYFARFCQELHRRGMRIILDGVFNHCGSFNKWMDKEGIYLQSDAYEHGAYNTVKSPYRKYFQFYDKKKYDSWWGNDTLPKLNYEASRELCEEIFHVAEKWASPPYSIDGWRLDVGADLGHSREFNHLFWKEFRRRVKAVNPDILIVAEHYGNPSEWLGGDEWDTVMNYDAFMEPVTYFLTGMEKHSDFRREDLYQNGKAFFDMMHENMARLPFPSMQCAMNELSNHDHSRFLTRTNCRIGRVDSAGSEAAGEDVRLDVLRQAAVIQMTWPGAPTIYYGDEAGVVGWTDPDNRRTYPWGQEDKDLIALHCALTALRRRYPVLRCGSLRALTAGYGYIAYARFDRDSCVITACNNGDDPHVFVLPLHALGIPEGTEVYQRLATNESGFEEEPVMVGTVHDGVLLYRLTERRAAVLTVKMPG